jgi:NAD(P)-dependent dehydrogenase (short-subunit alcohol dehydrogenase family)
VLDQQVTPGPQAGQGIEVIEMRALSVQDRVRLIVDNRADQRLLVYAVNVKAPFILTGELAPPMAARGKGSIINVQTMVAHFGVAGMALYGSSKAALTLLTKAWSAEFGPSGVRVNAVSPGPTRTEGTEVMGDQLDQLAALAPAGRAAAPEEIASAISYLAGDEASFVHGAVLDVDGGRRAA